MSNADLLASQPDYLKTFSLKCEPFANDLDGRFFYAGSALMQRLDLLTHLTQFGDSVVLVSGPQGSGKTTLLGRFAGQANKQWRLCLINADEFSQFRQRLADTLRVGEAVDEQALLENWVNQTDNSQLLVIGIDNAEQLQEDAFEKLCKLLNQPFAERIRLLLFGTPDAQLTLKQALDQKNLTCTTQLLEVPRLSEEETASYLMYRLAVAGYSGESPFTATEVRAICKAADGRPAEINRLAKESLVEHQARAKSKRGRKQKNRRKPGALFWGPASLLVVGAALYLGWERLQPVLKPGGFAPEQTAAKSDTAEPVVQTEPLAEAVPAGPDTASPTTARSPETPPPVAVLTPAPTPEPATTTPQPDTAKAPLATDARASVADIEAPAMAEVPPTSETETAPAAEIAAAPLAQTPAETLAAPLAETPAAPPAETPAAPPAETVLPAEQPSQRVTESPAVVADVKPPPPETPTTVNAGPLPHREAWLLQQDGNAFGLQLLGSRKEKSILEYIERTHLDPAKLAYYRGNYRGSEWYVLIYGTFPDKSAALKARDALPAKVRAEKPWPRTMNSVKKAIEEMQ